MSRLYISTLFYQFQITLQLTVFLIKRIYFCLNSVSATLIYAFPFSYELSYFDSQLFLRPLLPCYVSYTHLLKGEILYFLYLARKPCNVNINICWSLCKVSANFTPVLNRNPVFRHTFIEGYQKNSLLSVQWECRVFYIDGYNEVSSHKFISEYTLKTNYF